MKDEIYWASNISVSVVASDLFVFDEVTNNVYFYRGIKKACFLLFRDNHNLDNVAEIIADDYKQKYVETASWIKNFVDQCLKIGLLIKR